jgi:lipid A 3-O-deacylase
MVLDSVAVVVVAAAAFAGGAVVATHQTDVTPSLLGASAGWVDVDRKRQEALEIGLGYRGAGGPWALRPFLAATVTTDGAVYGWTGIAYDLRLGPLTLSPSFGPGLYHQGDGIDLGHVVEFRTQLEAAFHLGSRSRIGVSFAHMSNAGLGDINPGTEILSLHYSLAFGASR